MILFSEQLTENKTDVRLWEMTCVNLDGDRRQNAPGGGWICLTVIKA